MTFRARPLLASSAFALLLACGETEPTANYFPGGSTSSPASSSGSTVTVTVVNQAPRLALAVLRFLPEGASSDKWSANLLPHWLKSGASMDVRVLCDVELIVFVSRSDSSSTQSTETVNFPCGEDTEFDIE